MKILHIKWFITIAATLLAVTGAAKTLSLIGADPVLSNVDPITGIGFRALLPAVGIVELLVAACCFSNRLAINIRLKLIAWLTSSFLIYRVGLLLLDWHHPCACMGNLAGVLHIRDRVADGIMKCVLGFMLTGSYLCLIEERRLGNGHRRASRTGV
jgi:hypothetical protein